MEKTHPNLMYVSDLAKYLGRTEGAVRMMIRRGLLPYRRHGGRLITFKNEIDSLLEAAPGLHPEDFGIETQPKN